MARNKRKENDLPVESEEMWNIAAAERHEPRSTRRTVLSVAMPSEELELVSLAAAASEMKVSEFVRNAAVEKARFTHKILRASAVTLSLSNAGVFAASNNASVFEANSADTQVYGLPPTSLLLEV